jgi:SAM-dependent methyltransferase
MPDDMPALRIHLGCGPMARPGWINCDLRALPGVDLRFDLCRGLPFASGSACEVAAIHVLQDLTWPAIAPLLREVHRVLQPEGVLRLGVPDLDKAIDAYRANDPSYFYVPDADARCAGAKLVTQIVWYGSVRTPCNFAFLQEWLHAAGFARVERRAFGESAVAELAAHDNRERETLFVEAVKQGRNGAGELC